MVTDRLRRGRPRKTHPMAGDDRMRPAQLQSVASRRNRPPKRPTPPVGSTFRSRSRRTTARTTPSDTEIKGDDRDAAGRLLDQLRRPPTARHTAPTRRRSFGTARRSRMPGGRKGRHGLSSTARSCRVRSPAASISANPSRATATGSSSSPTASHPRQARRLRHARPEDRAADHRLRKPAAVALHRVRPALLRLRARPPGDADAVRHLRGQHRIRPWATGLPNQTSTQFFSITSGPNGQPCPGASRPFSPGFRAVGAGNGAGAHTPVLDLRHPQRRRPER